MGHSQSDLLPFAEEETVCCKIDGILGSILGWEAAGVSFDWPEYTLEWAAIKKRKGKTLKN